ncbi:MAG: PKD domain-containing protein [Acidobacteriota bacterium]
MKPFTTRRSTAELCMLALVAVSLLTGLACKRDEVNEPGPPTGPSGASYFVSIFASPSVLPSNTGATSTITAILRKYDGSPIGGKPLRFEIVDGSLNTINLGSLSQKNVTTDTAGVARTTYTVPGADVEGYLWIRATWTDSPWTEQFFSTVPLSLRFKTGPPVSNEYPIASFEIVTPGPYDVNQEITFDGKASEDPDGIIVKWVWDFGDKRTLVSFETMENELPTLNQPIVTHKFKLAGSYVITLKVIDDLGAYDIAQDVIIVGDVSGLAPTACYVITTQTTTGYDPDTDVQFDGSCSSDPDGAIRRWDWNWGDGKYSWNAGYLVTHRWHKVGSYPVSLTVTDDSGLKGIISENITIGGYGSPKSPTASFTFAPAAPEKGQQVVFDATASSDSDGVIQSYDFAFGDGSHSEGTSPIVYHAYNNDGYYFCVLTVTDDDGLLGVATQTIPVGGHTGAPVACFVMTPDPSSGTVTAGERIKFDGTCSTDSNGVIMTWTWMFGDGTVEHDRIQTHVYYTAGTYTVFLRVYDNEGLDGVTSQTFEILAGIPPDADAGADQSFSALACPLAKMVSFNGGLSTDPDGYIAWYNWDFGDGTTSGNVASASISHTYSVLSTIVYSVVLTVTDDDGLTDTDTCSVQMTCAGP